VTKTGENSMPKVSVDPVYEVNAVIPTDLISDLLKLLRRNGGQLLRIVSHDDSKPPIKHHGKVPAHEVVIDALRSLPGSAKELHRMDLRAALESSGHSPSSVGPICSMLRKQGRVISSRRGFWQLRQARPSPAAVPVIEEGQRLLRRKTKLTPASSSSSSGLATTG
jgi:hypothetical protein